MLLFERFPSIQLAHEVRAVHACEGSLPHAASTWSCMCDSRKEGRARSRMSVLNRAQTVAARRCGDCGILGRLAIQPTWRPATSAASPSASMTTAAANSLLGRRRERAVGARARSSSADSLRRNGSRLRAIAADRKLPTVSEKFRRRHGALLAAPQPTAQTWRVRRCCCRAQCTRGRRAATSARGTARGSLRCSMRCTSMTMVMMVTHLGRAAAVVPTSSPSRGSGTRRFPESAALH
mmetsp:Transcript_27446/g.60217  ORF Transcript_27446/g.60217 Transcript_27446/m.60217 type:complete len:237 (+) Transcript_27446:586-1296(+)